MEKTTIPEGQIGDWAVKKFYVREEDAAFTALRALMHGGRGAVPSGDYYALMYRGAIVMSDTPNELSDQRMAIIGARGYVLVTGLGLGIIVDRMLQSEQYDPLCRDPGKDRISLRVKHLTVVEKHLEVIQLVGPTLQGKYGDRLAIINADAFEWQPGDRRFDYAYHDIWTDITSENLPGMRKLKRKYWPYLTATGKQRCWLEDECRRMGDGGE